MKKYLKERIESDCRILDGISFLWLLCGILSIMIGILLPGLTPQTIVFFYGITLLDLILFGIPVIRHYMLLVVSALIFSAKLLLSLPFIILIYGVSNVPKHVRRHVRHFLRVQRTRKEGTH